MLWHTGKEIPNWLCVSLSFCKTDAPLTEEDNLYFVESKKNKTSEKQLK